MIKVAQWLVRLAQRNPAIFSVAVMLIASYIAYQQVKYSQARVSILENEKREMQVTFDRRVDSIIAAHDLREEKLSEETKATLKAMLEDYKEQLREQKNLTRKIDNTISENERILKRNQDKLKSLNNDY